VSSVDSDNDEGGPAVAFFVGVAKVACGAIS
jgi:hypothetical protein